MARKREKGETNCDKKPSRPFSSSIWAASHSSWRACQKKFHHDDGDDDVDPNPDLTDAGEAENRWDGDSNDEDDHHDDSDDDGDHHDDDSDKDDDDAECEDGLIETFEKVLHVNVSISCREGEEEQDNHKQGDFTPISGEFRFQKLVAITVIMLTSGILYLL